MATIVLTAVGGLVGGPIGAALGAIAGQRIDSSILAPKGRQGPRLGDLSIQTSSYGTAIPKIFGTMRVAGTVIWATDLKEHKSRSGGGKGRPKTETYSYSASFAVALSGRPIRSVRRIWADGKLLRGAAGDFKSQADFRLYLGGEDQPVDPRIGAEEGLAKAPAHRGMAYALFEDFQLADFGNRIPSLTFEVEADAAPVAVGAIAEQLTVGDVRAGQTGALAGYAASGDSLRGAIEALSQVLPLSLVEGEEAMLLSEVPSNVVALSDADIGSAEGASGGRSEFSKKSAIAVPSEVSIAYHDQARDYQTGLQRARRGPVGARSEQIALPAVLDADGAKGLAERRLEHLWAARETGTVPLSSRCLKLRPGMLVSFAGRRGAWKVSRWSLDRMRLKLELTRAVEGVRPTSKASPGRPVSEADLLHGPTTLFLFELPSLGDELATRPQLVVTAAGTSPGWRAAALLVSYDRGASWVPEGGTAAAAVMGHALSAAAPSGSALFDDRTVLEVELLNEEMWLESRDDEALAGGANLAALGKELIQFGRAEPMGSNKFRLSQLLRGRRGTEWAAGSHVAGEPFAMIERETARIVEPPLGSLGGEVRLLPQGIGDPADASSVGLRIDGNVLAPPSVTHLSAERRASGDIDIGWVRRSRLGWNWGAGTDAPLAEETETYRLKLSGEGFERVVTLGEPSFTYTAAQQASDGLSGELRIEVVQIGTYAASILTILSIQ